tara:strand:+ start:2277 stop:3794 length:1518 start_codon:yes stop_codon:yes gene_type:complete
MIPALIKIGNIGFLFFLILSFGNCSLSKNKIKKNVLMIIVDDLRTEIQSWGRTDIITPNLDKLSRKGVSFHNAFAQYANCSPSRISMLTGLSPETTGHTGNLRSKPEFSRHVTLPGHFKEHGYYTASIGKVYHDARDDRKSWDYYFDLVSPDKSWTDPTNRWECYADSINNTLLGTDRPAVEKTDKDLEAYKDYQLCKNAMSLIEKQKDNPFFITVGFRKPHLPFAAPEKYWDLYDRENINLSKFPISPEKSDSIVYQWSELSSYNYYSESYKTSNYKNKIIKNNKARELRHGYFACVSFIDDLVGLLVKKLEELNLDKNTIIVVTGDHGYQLGDQQIWGKHSNYHLSTRVPLIIFDPLISPIKNISKKYIELLNLYPSLSELASLPAPANLDGKSFISIFHESEPKEFNLSFSQYQSFQKNTDFSELVSFALHSEDYTYIEWQDKKSNYKIVNRELYNLNPVERQNIADNPVYKNQIEEFSMKLNQKFRQYRLKSSNFKISKRI